MKIVYLSHARIPSRTANSINVMKMCEAFALNGHRVVLLVPECIDPEPEVDDPFRFYGIERRFKLRRLPLDRDRCWGWLRYFTIRTVVPGGVLCAIGPKDSAALPLGMPASNAGELAVSEKSRAGILTKPGSPMAPLRSKPRSRQADQPYSRCPSIQP